MVAQAGDGDLQVTKKQKTSFQTALPGYVRSTEAYSISPGEWQLREDLAAAYRLCHRMGFNEGVCNHLTVALPGSSDTFLLIAYGLLWSEVTAGNLLTVQACSGSCKVLYGTGVPETTAFWIHSRIHVARPHDAAVVFHTHVPWTTSLCCLEDPRLPMIHQNCLRYFNDIAYDPVYIGLVEDVTEGDRLAAAMGNNRIMLHGNHGIIVAAPNVWQAFDDMYYFERAAEVVVKTRSMNLPVKYIPEETCRKFKACQDAGAEEYAWQYFHALKRDLRLGRDKQFEDRSDVLPREVLPGARS